jgi:indolepyruvate decarboxylase
MKLAHSLLQALRAHGAQQIFGIPGDFALPFFKVIEESGVLPLHTLSHEPAVGFASDAAARVNCAPGVAAVTYGAGALNMVNAVAGAYAERSPVVVISGAPGKGEARAGLLLHHQAKTLDSQYRIFREITCEQVRLDDAARAPARIARALARCRSESRPVYIELPRDMVGVECGAVDMLPPIPSTAARSPPVDESRRRRGETRADGRRRSPPLRAPGTGWRCWRGGSGCRWSPA